ncbi:MULTISPECIES: hypothetical protein [unclassified Streptomyces]|nr:hypothetical protein [Streptomyces sp. NBC_00228]WSW96365.1 hypothetical protein OG714_44075 [Streptomyces sp. NBC_00989]
MSKWGDFSHHYFRTTLVGSPTKTARTDKGKAASSTEGLMG